MIYLKRGIIGMLIGILLELFVFNSGYFLSLLDYESDVIVLPQEQFTAVNWDVHGELLISETDPQLILEGVNRYVQKITIYCDVQPSAEGITVFYTNGENPVACEKTMRTARLVDGRASMTIRDTIGGLRVDVGESAGAEMYSFQVVLNERYFHFSISHVIAVILIALLGTFLFNIQKMPDYHLEEYTTQDRNN